MAGFDNAPPSPLPNPSPPFRLRALSAFHQLSEQGQRLLPAEGAVFRGDGFGDAFLGDVDVDAAGQGAEVDGGLHGAGEGGVVELGGVAQALVGDEFEVLAAEGVAVAGGEVGEGHAVAAALAGVLGEHVGGEAVGGQPFAQGVGVEEGAVDAFGGGGEYAVELDGVGGHGGAPGVGVVVSG